MLVHILVALFTVLAVGSCPVHHSSALSSPTPSPSDTLTSTSTPTPALLFASHTRANPTSSSTPSDATPTASSTSSASGATYTGIVTYYYQENQKSACGGNYNDTALIGAVGPEVFDNANVCDKTASITALDTGKVLEVLIVDRCAGCNSTHVDLSIAAFNYLSNNNLLQGVLPVEWGFV